MAVLSLEGFEMANPRRRPMPILPFNAVAATTCQACGDSTPNWKLAFCQGDALSCDTDRPHLHVTCSTCGFEVLTEVLNEVAVKLLTEPDTKESSNGVSTDPPSVSGDRSLGRSE